jgi:hypothetical protein
MNPAPPEALVIVVTAPFDEVHTTDCSVCVEPSLKVPRAVNKCVSPTSAEGLEGKTAILTSEGGVRVAGV